MRSRASRMSVGVGAVSVFIDLEHPNHDLSDRGEGVELPPLHLVEQTSQLRIVGHGLLEMELRTGRGDREDLPGEILAPTLVEETMRLEVLAVRRDLLPE